VSRASARLTVAEALDLLRSPFGMEDLASSIPALLCVDLADSLRALSESDLDDLAELLESVRAVTVGIVSAPLPKRAHSTAGRFDVLVGEESPENGDAIVHIDPVDDALAALAAATAANPDAAVAMGQLMRQGSYQSVPNGLVLESLTYSMLQSGGEFRAWLEERGPAEVPPDPEPPVLGERIGSALQITLNRPQRANAVSAGLRDALVEQLRVAAADPSIEGVVIRGAGRAFCAGGDLAEFGSTPDPAIGHATRLTRSAGWWVHRLSSRTRVHLHGACIGAGIEVPSFAGTVIAASDTRIRLPEVSMGLVPGAGGTVSMPRRIGPQRTAYMAITGRELGADEALAWGLVDRIED
jgi:enoyl-CoA hydratase/carnithine racemase